MIRKPLLGIPSRSLRSDGILFFRFVIVLSDAKELSFKGVEKLSCARLTAVRKSRGRRLIKDSPPLTGRRRIGLSSPQAACNAQGVFL